jgi:hypothetical protein
MRNISREMSMNEKGLSLKAFIKYYALPIMLGILVCGIFGFFRAGPRGGLLAGGIGAAIGMVAGDFLSKRSRG